MAIQVKGIDGFYMIPNVFNPMDSEYWIKTIEINRGNACKQIHTADEFGWKFIPVEKKSKKDYLGKNPEWLDKIWNIAFNQIKNKIDDLPNGLDHYDHVLINHYNPDDGCKSHIDDVKFWDEWVLGVSFGSGCILILTSEQNQIYNIYLPPNSVFLLLRDSRYKCKHGISFESVCNVYGNQIQRTKRISLTFRTISFEYLSQEERT